MPIIENIQDRGREVQDACRRFEIGHLTDPDARQIGMAAARFGSEMVQRIRRDDAELVRALTLLADARDAFMRAKIYEQNGGSRG